MTAVALIALGVGLAAGALLGPLALAVVKFRVSPSAENQLVGGDLVSLLLAAPVAVVSGILWLRGHRLAPALAGAPALYAVYTSLQLVLGPEYSRYPGNNESFFPLYLALTLLGWIVAVLAWDGLGALSLMQPSANLRRALAIVLIVLNAIFALAWVASVAAVLGGAAGPDYRSDPTLFWLVRVMDLAFVIPVALITAAGLLRNAPWAARLAYPVAGFQTLEVAAVAAMAIAMAVRGDPASNPGLLAVTVAFALALGVLDVLWLRAAARGAGARAAQSRSARGPDPAGAPHSEEAAA